MYRQIIRRYLPIIYFVCSVFTAGCGSDNNGGAVLTSITITPINSTISMGVNQQFTAVGLYSDSTAKDLTGQVTWTSSDPTKAIVDSSGVVTPVAAGTANILATSDLISGSTTLTITEATLMSITLTPGNSIIAMGTDQQFTAFGIYSDGTTTDLSKQVSWTSSDPNVAIVKGSGVVEGVESGKTQITATTGMIAGATTATVKAATLTSIQVTPLNTTLLVGTDQQFTAVGIYSDNIVIDLTKQVTWTSTDPTIATVNSNGLVTGVSTGTIQVTATLGSISGYTNITLTVKLMSIIISNADPYGDWHIYVSQVISLIATGLYSDGTQKNITTQVTWSSSDPDYASVSETGIVTSLSRYGDQVEISATLDNVSAVQTIYLDFGGSDP
jgi:uncharacterized protein YjdB